MAPLPVALAQPPSPFPGYLCGTPRSRRRLLEANETAQGRHSYRSHVCTAKRLFGGRQSLKASYLISKYFHFTPALFESALFCVVSSVVERSFAPSRNVPFWTQRFSRVYPSPTDTIIRVRYSASHPKVCNWTFQCLSLHAPAFVLATRFQVMELEASARTREEAVDAPRSPSWGPGHCPPIPLGVPTASGPSPLEFFTPAFLE